MGFPCSGLLVQTHSESLLLTEPRCTGLEKQEQRLSGFYETWPAETCVLMSDVLGTGLALYKVSGSLQPRTPKVPESAHLVYVHPVSGNREDHLWERNAGAPAHAPGN